MNRIDAKFAELKESGQTALIPYMTIGDPSLDVSLELVRAMEDAGADLLELGVPYSDPLADGPVIQEASERALAGGATIIDCMKLAGKARAAGSKLPFILFTYYNPVLQVGLDRFFDLVEENDINGLIIPDLPMEEGEELRALASSRSVHLIPLVAPTSEQRIRAIASNASGFVYCVSSLGVTGMRSEFAADVEQFLRTVKESTNLPIAVGFGISSGEQVKHFGEICDGVVVGSAIVKQIGQAIPLLVDEARRQEGIEQVKAFVSSLKRG